VEKISELIGKRPWNRTPVLPLRRTILHGHARSGRKPAFLSARQGCAIFAHEYRAPAVFPANQAAVAHNIGVVRSFLDEDKSGTTIKGRRGLQGLLRGVLLGTADFEIILVYDVSRWGRFQNGDDSRRKGRHRRPWPLIS
jgi:hypothetical protein